jgi:hypothetical protein
MPLDQIEMQRQLHQYAMEEMRNRALEEAALLAAIRPAATGYWLADEIRRLKRDPAAKMTDWWADDKPKSVADYASDRVFDGTRPIPPERLEMLRKNYDNQQKQENT